MATNMFVKFDGVTGECTDVNHKDWIEILSWSHGFSQPTSAVRASSGATVERANHSNLSITKYMDSATDDLLKICWSGKQVATVSVECFRSDGNNAPVLYLKIEMLGVIVSNYSLSGGGGDIPIENLSLSYKKVTYTYKSKKKEDGTADAQQPVYHDLSSNEVG